MNEAADDTAQDALLRLIHDRLERALDLSADTTALQHFPNIADLCRDAVHLARAGALLVEHPERLTPLGEAISSRAP